MITPEQFHSIYPRLLKEIHNILTTNAGYERKVYTADFKRLPLYFSKTLLESTKFVLVDKIPIPPLSDFGFKEFSEFENGEYGGITYLDTFFVKRRYAEVEDLFFHELIHILQWQILGPEHFLAEYVSELIANGYRDSLLEIIAYDAQSSFVKSTIPFDAERLTIEQLRKVGIL